MPPRFEIIDPEFRDLIPTNAAVERIAAGFKFTEGPVWRGDHLLFSDIPNSRIVRWQMLSEGPEVRTFRCPSGQSNGLTLDREGRLIACEHGNRRVSRTEADGSVSVLANAFEGHRLNSPNDVVVKADGSIYFTDPPYGLPNQSEGKELPFQGVYRIAPNGALTLLVDDFDRPNGLAFSPDEKVLYVDDTNRRHIRAFDVRPDGSLAGGRVFADLASPDSGSPDGMKVDVRGNIYCCGPGGIWLFAPDARLLGRIFVPEQPCNVAFGIIDWRMLFITAQTGLYRIPVGVQGVPPWESDRPLHGQVRIWY